jgi:hypothetical protein
MVLLRRENIDFSKARPVVSPAQKFVIPIAVLHDADRLVYPPGDENAGQPIVDWNGKVLDGKGIVFRNGKDNCCQAALADGHNVIIVNEVSASHARAIENFIRHLAEPIEALSKSSLARLIDHLATELRLVDVYDSTDDFVCSKMIPIGDSHTTARRRPAGWMKRNDQDIWQAVFVAGPAEFAGPAPSPQTIPVQGAFIVRQDLKYHLVDSEVMMRTYMNPDGSPLDFDDFLRGH